MTQARLLTLLLAFAGGSFAAQAQTAAPTSPEIQSKVAACIGCHGIKGYQASFPEIYKVPMISGQGAQYTVAALNAYKKGERKHPTMRSVAGVMSEQDMADVAAYYEQHGKTAATLPPQPAPPTPAVAALLTKGACASCHGANFSAPIDPSYPKLAGQHADYLYFALKSYQTVGNAKVGRSNAIMVGQVKQFSRAELKAMANYFAGLPSDLHTVPQAKFR